MSVEETQLVTMEKVPPSGDAEGGTGLRSDPGGLCASILNEQGAVATVLFVSSTMPVSWVGLHLFAVSLAVVAGNFNPAFVYLLGSCVLGWSSAHTYHLMREGDPPLTLSLISSIGVAVLQFCVFAGSGFMMMMFTLDRFSPRDTPVHLLVSCFALISPVVLIATANVVKGRKRESLTDSASDALFGGRNHPPWERALTKRRALVLLPSYLVALLVSYRLFFVARANGGGPIGGTLGVAAALALATFSTSTFGILWTAHLMSADRRRRSDWRLPASYA